MEHLEKTDEILLEAATHENGACRAESTAIGILNAHHESVEALFTLTIEQATEADFDRIQAVREECSWEQTQAGTSYLKRLQPDELESMLPVSLVMRINGNIAGTIYVEEVRSHPGVASIGGFAVAKKYRKFRLSETLLKSAITKAAQDGYEKAISITASQKVKELFRLAGGMEGAEEYIDVFVKALRRYVIAERDLVSLFEFDLQS